MPLSPNKKNNTFLLKNTIMHKSMNSKITALCLPMIFFVVGAGSFGFVLSKALHRESHSKRRARPVGTNGCNLGIVEAIFSPRLNNVASCRRMGGHLFGNPLDELCSNRKRAFSYSWLLSLVLSFWGDIVRGKCGFLLAQFRGRIALQSSTGLHCRKKC